MMDYFADIESRYRLHYLATARITSAVGRSSRALQPATAGREALALALIALALRLAPSLRSRLNRGRAAAPVARI